MFRDWGRVLYIKIFTMGTLILYYLFVLLIAHAHHLYWVRCLIVDEIVSHIVFFYVLIKTMWRILFEIFTTWIVLFVIGLCVIAQMYLVRCWVPRCLHMFMYCWWDDCIHVSVSHILFIYVLIKTMIHAVCSSKSKLNL